LKGRVALPALAGCRVAGELCEPTVELGGLGVGDGEAPRLGGDAVPEVLSELDALGDGELREVEVIAAHGSSLPPEGEGGNRRVADIDVSDRCTANVGLVTCAPRHPGVSERLLASA
jgi:hypothetical protein